MTNEDAANGLLGEPRLRHYVLAHEAFRQVSMHAPNKFFAIMATPEHRDFVADLVAQVEQGCPEDDTRLELESIKVHISRMGNKPLVLIEMPPARAFIECVYVGVVGMLDITRPEDFPDPEVGYFTLELGEGESGECRFFCQWDGDDHLNLAEMDETADLGDFASMIKQHLDGR